MKFQTLRGIFLLSFLSLTFSACLPDGDAFNSNDWQPELAIPLFSAEFGLEDILAQFDSVTSLEVDPDRLLHIIYEGEVFSLRGEDFFQFPNIVGPVADTSGSISTVFPGLGTIYRADFKKGGLSFNLTTLDTGQIRLKFNIPELENNGTTFQFDTLFDGPGQVRKSLSLAGYSLLSPEGEVSYIYESNLVSNGDPVELLGTITFDSTSYTYIEGILEPITVETGIDTIAIELFEANASALLEFQDFDLDITFRNSVGLPVRGTMKQFLAITNQGGIRDINSDLLKDGVDFEFPSLMEVGETKETYINLNPDNSDLAQTISKGPTEMVYQVEGQTLPMTEAGFLTDSSQFGVDISLDLPLHLTAKSLFLEQKREFVVNDWGPLDDVLEASFRIQTENGYPLDLDMQLYLMDENSDIIDSVFDSFQPILAAGPVDEDARVTEPGILNFDIELPASRLDNLQLTKFILVQLKTNTLNDAQTPVKIFDDYTFVLKMGLKAKLDPGGE
jgi:hypothetical protein